MYAPDSRSPRTTLLRWAVCLLSAWLCLGSSVQPAQAAVIISSFTAAWMGNNVIVEWETASELETAGFYVQRSDSQNGVYIRITEFIVAKGDDISGASYYIIDSNVTSGNTYWYKLETIDLNQESEYYPPVSAIPLIPTSTFTFTPSPTLAITPTETNFPTATHTQVQSIPSATQLPPTAYPGPATATRPPAQPTTPPVQPTQPLLPTPVVPAATGVISPTTILSATATLIPLPEITLTFPAGGIVIQKHGTATITPAPTRQSAGVSGRKPAGGVMLISVIVLIWILLGVWFYMSFRRVE